MQRLGQRRRLRRPLGQVAHRAYGIAIGDVVRRPGCRDVRPLGLAVGANDGIAGPALALLVAVAVGRVLRGSQLLVAELQVRPADVADSDEEDEAEESGKSYDRKEHDGLRGDLGSAMVCC